jgi:uncharacterized OB-fold protein
MTATGKYRPQDVPGWQRPFWDSVRAHAVAVQRCTSCGTYRYAPKELCHRCHCPDAEWRAIEGRGTIYTFTVIRRAPNDAYQAEAPYILAHVEMTEGFRMIGVVRGMSVESVRIGMPVVAAYEDIDDEWSLLEFRPDEDATGESEGARR